MINIEKLLVSNAEAVERAILALYRGEVSGLSHADATSVRYFGSWVAGDALMPYHGTSEPRQLSGSHLARARALALRYVDGLRLIAERNKVRQVNRATPLLTAAGSSLTMTREGEFSIVVAGNNHCGAVPAGTTLRIRYKAIVKCAATLDNRGFLFDQMKVDSFFQSMKRTTLSCEALTIRSANDLVAVMQEENPGVKIHAMDLTLSPQPFVAGMTYTWKGLPTLTYMGDSPERE